MKRYEHTSKLKFVRQSKSMLCRAQERVGLAEFEITPSSRPLFEPRDVSEE